MPHIQTYAAPLWSSNQTPGEPFRQIMIHLLTKSILLMILAYLLLLTSAPAVMKIQIPLSSQPQTGSKPSPGLSSMFFSLFHFSSKVLSSDKLFKVIYSLAQAFLQRYGGLPVKFLLSQIDHRSALCRIIRRKGLVNYLR